MGKHTILRGFALAFALSSLSGCAIIAVKGEPKADPLNNSITAIVDGERLQLKNRKVSYMIELNCYYDAAGKFAMTDIWNSRHASDGRSLKDMKQSKKVLQDASNVLGKIECPTVKAK